MALLLTICAITTIVWAVLYFRHGSLTLGGIAFVALGYIFTNNFWNLGLGPVSLNVGRVLLLGLVAMFAWRLWQGRLEKRPLTRSDWVAALLVAYISIRYFFTSEPIGEPSSVPPTWRLIASIWMPASLFVVMRYAELTERSWKLLLGCLSFFGIYLAVTGIAEVHGQWWAVFPGFISDPELGTHFGRARGPQLMSASLGVFLTVCFWATWFLWARVTRVWKFVLLAAMPLMILALYFTFTRSTWLGLAGGFLVVPLLHWSRSWRPLLLTGTVLVGTFGLLVIGGDLVNLGRKDTDASASHSVYQRASFLYVSVQMFRDHPLFGCGFGRFFDQKMPYLSDRSQQIEIESLRHLDHHNTFLSILVETGALGLILLLGTLYAWSRASWELYRDTTRESWQRMHGIFSLAVLIAYVATAMFHDLTLSPSEHWMLCLIAGMTVGLQSQKCVSPSRKRKPSSVPAWSAQPSPQA